MLSPVYCLQRQFVSVFQRQDRAELCIDLGDVLDGLALHKDANELWTNACALMKGSMMDLGVSEMLEAPENRSKTLRGAQLYAESLIRLSIVLTVRLWRSPQQHTPELVC